MIYNFWGLYFLKGLKRKNYGHSIDEATYQSCKRDDKAVCILIPFLYTLSFKENGKKQSDLLEFYNDNEFNQCKIEKKRQLLIDLPANWHKIKNFVLKKIPFNFPFICLMKNITITINNIN